MHKEILTKKQIELLPVVKAFNKDFCLVGGTAIAFHIGHRRSIDFDMFSHKPFKNMCQDAYQDCLGTINNTEIWYN